MIEFSANLGFLWTDLPLVEAIAAAANAGFDAVECHCPYDVPAAAVRQALSDAGSQMLSLNTRTGGEGEIGVAALPGRETQAREYIDEAIAYAVDIGCGAVSVVAGISGRTEVAEHVYQENLAYATAQASPYDITVLIEPLNTSVSPDYHLVSADAACETIMAVGASNLKVMLDTFHASKMHGDLEPLFARVIDHVGHVQFASIPDRAEPNGGVVDYGALLPHVVELGYDRPFGAEYTPRVGVEDGLGWMNQLRGGAS